MTLHELLRQHAWRPDDGVPDWMLGWFKRYSISFADGLTDVHTHVCWLQSRNFTIDLRLPRRDRQPDAEQGLALREQRWADIRPDTWMAWADFEGWKAPATWDGTRLRWHAPDAGLQWHDRWPEPALLHRVGQCMVEFCDSGAYVEDWRLQPSAPGPLVGLHLLCERDADTGTVRHVGGGWIVCGDHAALVRGRPPLHGTPAPMLREAVANLLAHRSAQDPAGGAATAATLASLFDFETSVATWDGQTHRVQWSTRPDRVGEPLCPLDGLDWIGHVSDADADPIPVDVPAHLRHLPRVRQTLQVDGRRVTRHFAVDTLEPEVGYSLCTPCTDASQAWMQRESRTLGRYTDVLRDAHSDPAPTTIG